MPIRDFLLARIREDEVLAESMIDRHGDSGFAWAADHEDDARYLDRWGPWRVLALCVMRRQLVRTHGDSVVEIEDPVGGKGTRLVCGECGPTGYPEPWPCQTLRVLALDWVSHPEYRPEWRQLRRPSTAGGPAPRVPRARPPESTGPIPQQGAAPADQPSRQAVKHS